MNSSNSTVHIGLCPGVVIEPEGRDPIRVPSGTPGLLLIRLALQGSREYGRDQLVEFIWPQCDRETGRPRLRFALSVLRGEFGLADALNASKNEVALDWSRVDTDVELFRRKVKQAMLECEPVCQAELLLCAAAGLHGELAEQHSAPWLDLARRELRNNRIEALARAAKLLGEAGELGKSEEALRSAIHLDRYRESLHQELIQLLAGSGRSGEAVAHFEDLRQSMLRDIGIPPSEALRSTAMPPSVSTPRPSMPPEQEVVEYVAHGPELFGRREELAALVRLTRRAGHVTLVGPGGVGKSTLADAFAREVAKEYPDGIYRIELSSLPPGSDVTASILTELGISGGGIQHPLTVIKNILSTGRRLLILDNCEHVVAHVARLLRELSGIGGSLRTIATSRQPLRIVGEAEFTVLPLRLPTNASIEEMAASPAVQLLAARVQAFDRDFTVNEGNVEPLYEIVIRVEGLPLALELAAARMKTLSIQTVAKHLRESFALLSRSSYSADARQMTLRNTVAWSYQLLSPEESLAFARLSVFPASWTMRDAEAIEGPRAVDLVSELVEKSLVHRTGNPSDGYSFRMFAPLRAFAEDRLDQLGVRLEAEASLIRLAVLDMKEVEAASNPDAMIEGRLDTYVAALRACLVPSGSRASDGLRIARGLRDYWISHSLTEQGLEFMYRLLPLAEQTCTLQELVEGYGAGWMIAMWHGNGRQAIHFADRQLEISLEVDDVAVRDAKYNVARAKHAIGLHRESVQALDEYCALCDAAGVDTNVFLCRARQCELAMVLDDMELGERAYWHVTGMASYVSGLVLRPSVPLAIIAKTSLWLGRPPGEVASWLNFAMECGDAFEHLRKAAYFAASSAELAFAIGDVASGCRLHGFHVGVRHRLALAPDPVEIAAATRHEQISRAGLGESQFEVEVEIGSAMNYAELAECIRGVVSRSRNL